MDNTELTVTPYYKDYQVLLIKIYFETCFIFRPISFGASSHPPAFSPSSSWSGSLKNSSKPSTQQQITNEFYPLIARWREEASKADGNDDESIVEYDLDSEEKGVDNYETDILTLAAKQNSFDTACIAAKKVDKIEETKSKDGCDNIALELEERLDH